MDYEGLFSPLLNDEEDLLLFGRWAFGEDYNLIPDGMGFLKAWNEKHSEDHELKPDGDIHEDAKKMVDLWKNRDTLA